MRKLYRDAGEFRHQLRLLTNDKTEDDFGAFESDWTEQKYIWAKIMPASVRLRVRAGVEEPHITHIIELRQPLVIKAGMRLSSAQTNRVFSVRSVSDPDETRRYWRCECTLEENP